MVIMIKQVPHQGNEGSDLVTVQESARHCFGTVACSFRTDDRRLGNLSAEVITTLRQKTCNRNYLYAGRRRLSFLTPVLRDA